MVPSLTMVAFRSRLVGWVKRLITYVRKVGEIIGQDRAYEILSEIMLAEGEAWTNRELKRLDISGIDALSGWELLRNFKQMFGLETLKPEEHVVAESGPNKVVINCTAWCPILEACEELNIPTRKVCESLMLSFERGVLRALNPKLKLTVGKIRPEDKYCEYIIELVE
ncbi:hypothetical protein DRO33_02925 [Candidatus Bathyarchaeota archaeon]|nr:MAG: hypothetical protein DRO33_02925 [Candidatus Bathyarchaeota archaeon]